MKWWVADRHRHRRFMVHGLSKLVRMRHEDELFTSWRATQDKQIYHPNYGEHHQGTTKTKHPPPHLDSRRWKRWPFSDKQKCGEIVLSTGSPQATGIVDYKLIASRTWLWSPKCFEILGALLRVCKIRENSLDYCCWRWSTAESISIRSRWPQPTTERVTRFAILVT